MNDFFASLYEWDILGFYSSGFSEKVYQSFLYQKYGLILIVSVLILLGLYYKVLDRPKFSNRMSWAVFLLITMLLNFTFLYTDVQSNMEEQGLSFDGEYLSLAIVNGLYTLILFLLLSLVFKLFSINHSKIPF